MIDLSLCDFCQWLDPWALDRCMIKGLLVVYVYVWFHPLATFPNVVCQHSLAAKPGILINGPLLSMMPGLPTTLLSKPSSQRLSQDQT